MREYRRALRRLTLGYALAIVIACAAFTLPVLVIAQHRISEGVTFFNVLDHARGSAELRATVAERAAEGQRYLLSATIAIDVVLLGIGSLASYFFARKTLAPLEAAHRAQERFTADASHELKTPLAVMQTSLEVALKAGKSRAELEKIMHATIDEIRSLSALTEKLLELARTDTPMLHLSLIHLNTAIEDVIRQFEHHHKLGIVRQVEPSLQTKADETLLRQLLYVLLDNAVKYAGQNPPHITVRLLKTGKDGLFEITDTGIGISPDDLPRVFDRLYRGTNATAQKGNGLGLALAKSVVDLHGWKLTITSHLGKGTTVHIHLPLHA